ncbi:MAG: non-canonical purine NTP diphosphatase [Bacteroidetes bacterium]|jgi:XTP/dITP diphosphohydrolase|nr:non-canonical purine NTP diphosphatase [Bacteroidota bacterium]MDF1866427.1 non-canonical purine NTP diphosphatase [Saprospiraceae bacterium]
MKKIIFATSNPNKVREVKEILDGQYEVLSLVDIGCHEDIPETAPTFEGNALQKARYVYEKYGFDCFSEDTGLEVDALNGEPGIYTARYAGPARDADANMAKTIKELEGKANRGAQFRTAMALIIGGKETVFEGIVRGSIRKEKSGSGGFGYDPIFEPQGYEITFAEMDKKEKNKISHRGLALQKLIAYLKKLEE